jgi:hypothetical protein
MRLNCLVMETPTSSLNDASLAGSPGTIQIRRIIKGATPEEGTIHPLEMEYELIPAHAKASEYLIPTRCCDVATPEV